MHQEIDQLRQDFRHVEAVVADRETELQKTTEELNQLKVCNSIHFKM